MYTVVYIFYNFCIQNEYMISLLAAWIQDCGSQSCYFGYISFFWPCICFNTVIFPLLRNSDHVVVSVSIEFPSNSKGDAPLHSLWLLLCWLGQSSRSFEECSVGGYLKTQCFCCCYWILCVEVAIDIYIPPQKLHKSFINFHGFQLLALLS